MQHQAHSVFLLRDPGGNLVAPSRRRPQIADPKLRTKRSSAVFLRAINNRDRIRPTPICQFSQQVLQRRIVPKHGNHDGHSD